MGNERLEEIKCFYIFVLFSSYIHEFDDYDEVLHEDNGMYVLLTTDIEISPRISHSLNVNLTTIQ